MKRLCVIKTTDGSVYLVAENEASRFFFDGLNRLDSFRTYKAWQRCVEIQPWPPEKGLAIVVKRQISVANFMGMRSVVDATSFTNAVTMVAYADAT